MARTPTSSLFTPALIGPAVGDAFRKLDPRELIRNPVMFTTAVVATLLTVLLVVGQASHRLACLAIDPASGRLTKLGDCSVGLNPNWVETVALPR